jgi:hypothetical protein
VCADTRSTDAHSDVRMSTGRVATPVDGFRFSGPVRRRAGTVDAVTPLGEQASGLPENLVILLILVVYIHSLPIASRSVLLAGEVRLSGSGGAG